MRVFSLVEFSTHRVEFSQSLKYALEHLCVCVSGGGMLVKVVMVVEVMVLKVMVVKVVLSNTWGKVSSSGCCSSGVAPPTGERTDNNLNRYQPAAQLPPRPGVGRDEGQGGLSHQWEAARDAPSLGLGGQPASG